MHMADTKRSQNVCQACKLRKKTCDKRLPACTFCTNRSLPCKYVYNVSAATSRGIRKYNPGRNFVLLGSPLSLPPPSPLAQAAAFHYSIPCNFLDSRGTSGDEALHQLVQHYLDLTNLTYDHVIDRHFQATQQWLPVISCDSVRQEASRHAKEGPLPSDLSVLLLAMLLSILPTFDNALRPTREIQEALYITTKSAFSQVQTSICTSLRLVQASLLIALREYTCVRPDAAYISVATCTALTRVLGTGGVSRDAKKICESEGDMEKKNLVWAIAMFERVVLCERNYRDLQPQLGCPALDYELNSEKPTTENCTQELNTKPLNHLGLGAQSMSLLEQVLFIVRLTANSKDIKLTELMEVDSKIRSFLEMLMGVLGWTETLKCVHIAICIRLLFLLHMSALDILCCPTSEIECQKKEISWAGLNTVSKMTLDVADWYSEAEAQIMPITRFYTLRAARGYLQDRNNIAVDEARSRDIDRLLRAEDMYCKVWML